MDRESARQAIRTGIKCTDFLEKSKSGMYCCPFCGSGHGQHATGAVKYYPDTNTICCFGQCGKKKYDVIDLFQHETGTDYNTALSLLAQQLGIEIDSYRPADASKYSSDQNTTQKTFTKRPQPAFTEQPDIINTDTVQSQQRSFTEPTAQNMDYTEYYNQCRQRITDPAIASYLQSRGISYDTATAYWLGYDPAWSSPTARNRGKNPPTSPRLIIPTSKGHYIARDIRPQLTEKEKRFAKMNEGSPSIFNEYVLYAQDVQEIFVTEGAIDALSIIEAGATAIALNSISNSTALLNHLAQQRTEATLIICLDNDAAGRTASDEIMAGLQRLNISYIVADICEGFKDPNEALTANRPAFFTAVENAQRQARKKPDNVQYYIQSLMGSDIARFKKDIKTGFANLDKCAGGLYAGLYVVAAISSLGKTTFAHQIADQIAASGNDVLFFSMEQSRLEMVSKSLSRITAKKDLKNTVTSLAIRKGYLPQQVKDAVKEYTEAVKDHLSIIEGNFNCNISFIGDYIRQYMQRNDSNNTGNRPVVFIDYLQILQPAEDSSGKRQTTKETIDTTITELKRISRELEITIFIISSVNRANYLTPIDFESLKESGGIEYTADVIWGLQLQCLNDPIFDKANNLKERREKVKEAKASTPRQVELVCLKNRYGVANYSCFYDYYPAADLFTESDDPANMINQGPETTGKNKKRL